MMHTHLVLLAKGGGKSQYISNITEISAIFSHSLSRLTQGCHDMEWYVDQKMDRCTHSPEGHGVAVSIGQRIFLPCTKIGRSHG